MRVNPSKNTAMSREKLLIEDPGYVYLIYIYGFGPVSGVIFYEVFYTW